MASTSSHDLFISDTEGEEPLILTPVASDSEFEDLFESESLGDRSTTSTVPTQNSSNTSQSQHAKSRCRNAGRTTAQEPQSNTGVLRQRRNVRDNYSASAAILLRRLWWTSVALSAVFALGGYWGYSDEVMFLKNMQGLHGRYNAFRSRSCFGPNIEHGFRICLAGMAKKVDIIISTAAPSYNGLYLWSVKSWIQFLIIDVLCLPKNFVWFFVAMRHLLYISGYVYATLVAFNFASVNLGRRNRIGWNLARPGSLRAFIFRDLRFELKDFEWVPVIGFMAYMPWECIILRFFGIKIFDRSDRNDLVSAFKYFVWSGLFFRRVTRDLRRKSIVAKMVWIWYSWICFRYFAI